MNLLYSFSVHDIVDSILRQGSIDTRIFNSETMQEGTRMHKKIQDSSGGNYIPEVPLETTFDNGDIVLDIQGRADGIIHNIDGSLIVDEIKTTVEDLEKFKDENIVWHQGQAKMYAWMILRNSNDHTKSIKVRVSYYKQGYIKDKLIVEEDFTFDELDRFANDLIHEFIARLKEKGQHNLSRNKSIDFLEFPYKEYRPGQQDLIAFSNRILLEESKGYVEAPTGIGKTVCVLYPFIKNFKEGKISKIFYLTSKNSIKRQALKTVDALVKEGADLRCVAITAKETICMNDEGFKKHCNPDECPFAKDYYSKIYKVIRQALSEKSIFDEDDIKEIAMKNTICPFQLSLDLAVNSDICIYDYNYVFDPVVGNPEIMDSNLPLPYTLLVDEAHNLPSRAREMYSARLDREFFMNVYTELTGRKTSKLKSAIVDIISWFDMRKSDKDIEILNEVPDDFITLLKGFQEEGLNLEKKPDAKYPDSYVSLKSAVKGFLKLPLKGKENYSYDITYYNGKADAIHIFCLDASEYIRDISDRFNATLFFSATLSPVDYYISLLGGTKDDEVNKLLNLPSPFERRNRLVMVDFIPSLRYADRNISLPRVLNSIYQMVKEKNGNYFLYFPSYEYMLMAYERFEGLGEFVCIKQERNMTPSERIRFLDEFEEDPLRTHLGFLVLGGVFGEGIELKPHALNGVVIVSTGIPGIGYDNDRLKQYYAGKGLNGFDYAYTYPGFNKVIQAAGRVIRNVDDKGVILFIDRRFGHSNYRKLLDEVYPDRIYVSSPQEVREETMKFWKERS